MKFEVLEEKMPLMSYCNKQIGQVKKTFQKMLICGTATN